jgi:hypothetical protein
LQSSVIRRAAIVSGVKEDLDWISGKCHRVVVVSHSQGAEVCMLVFLDGKRDNVARWYTFGAGIAPLAMLHPKSLNEPASKNVVRASRVALGVWLAVLGTIALDMIPGVEWGARDLLLRGAQGIGWQWFLAAYVPFLVAAVFFGTRPGPVVRPPLRASLLAKWRDLYASEDPVPGGSLVNRFRTELQEAKLGVPLQWRIFNTRFAFLDHTSYFRNVEQFVAPIALDLLRLVGIGCDEQLEQPALTKARRRRDVRTWWNMVFTVLGLLAIAATVLWVAYGPSYRADVWLEQAREIGSTVPGFWDRLQLSWSDGLVGQVAFDLRWALATLLALCCWWALYWYLGDRSVKTLVRELATASRRATVSSASPVDGAGDKNLTDPR